MTQKNNPLLQPRRVVIKVGSALLTDENKSAIRKKWLASLVEDIAKLHNQDKQIIIVTSGAIALGRKHLGLEKIKLTLPQRQAAAACGQIQLMSEWQSALAKHNISTAQLLLTYDDSEHRKRYLNARNTLDTLLSARVIPVINENDTVALAELKVGDNDRLAARVAQMVSASLLVLLSDINGLYSADPRTDPNAKHIPEVAVITPAIEAMAKGARTHTSHGGMRTKIEAAKIAVAAGCHMIICDGTEEHPLKLLSGGSKHTLFHAAEVALSARKHWIVGTLTPTGKIIVDGGAARALSAGKSLLPSGVVRIQGDFARGDVVWIETADGTVLGRGLTSYNSDDAAKIKGHNSKDIQQLLGYKARDVLIHRDDMVFFA